MELHTGTAPHVYTLKPLQRFFSIFFALLCIGLCVAFFFSAREGDSFAVSVFAIMGTLFALGAVSMVAHVFRARMTLEGSRITVHGPFSERSADQRDIEGFRTIQTRNGSFQQLILRDNQGKITISSGFDTDDDFRAWMQQIPNLDERDRKATLAAIEQDAELGSTPEERLSALPRARKINITLLIVTIAGAIALNFGPQNFSRLAALFVAVAPAAGLYLVSRCPLLYGFLRPRSDPRTDVAGILVVSAVGLLIKSTLSHYVSYGHLAAFAFAVAILAIVFLLSYVRSSDGKTPPTLLFALLFFAGVYSFGLVATTDTLFDSSPGTRYVAPVVAMHISHGKSTSYHLTLAPWGPLKETNDFPVIREQYDQLQPGDSICLALHPGLLHVAWYTQSACPAGNQ